jgi:hypothetical protein
MSSLQNEPWSARRSLGGPGFFNRLGSTGSSLYDTDLNKAVLACKTQLRILELLG